MRRVMVMLGRARCPGWMPDSLGRRCIAGVAGAATSCGCPGYLGLPCRRAHISTPPRQGSSAGPMRRALAIFAVWARPLGTTVMVVKVVAWHLAVAVLVRPGWTASIEVLVRCD